MPWPMKNQYLDADDTVGTTFGIAEWLIERSGHISLICTGAQSFVIRHDSGRPWTGVDGGEAKTSLANIALAVARRLVDAERRADVAEAAADNAERFHDGAVTRLHGARRMAGAWKGLARMLRREIGDLETELQDAEHRAREAARDAHVTAKALAIGAARKDALESRVRDLDTANSALLAERQRTQAELLRIDAERVGMHEEATSLLTRARSAERRCVEQDAELLGRAVTMANLQYDLDRARGQAEAEGIRASSRLADMQAQRDRETTRAANAEAACRDATTALVKAEATVERARECVRFGLTACSDEEIIAEYARRYLPIVGR